MDVHNLLIRPMGRADVAEAERLSAEAFLEVDRAFGRRSDPEPALRSPERAVMWRARAEYLLHTDPGGCWVSERDGAMEGFAISFRRDTTWFLATYAVRPALQGQGVGKPLLEAALTHSRGCLRGMLAASDDPRALRRYRLAGFALHPQFAFAGILDRTAIPAGGHVRDGVSSDLELLESLDRRTRGAGRGTDHEVLGRLYRCLVVDDGTGSGYAYHDETGAVAALAATNRRTATRLLWESLAAGAPNTPVEQAHVNAANQWALDVAVAARLSISTSGQLALRGMKPPAPYIPHGSLL